MQIACAQVSCQWFAICETQDAAVVAMAVAAMAVAVAATVVVAMAAVATVAVVSCL